MSEPESNVPVAPGIEELFDTYALIEVATARLKARRQDHHAAKEAEKSAREAVNAAATELEQAKEFLVNLVGKHRPKDYKARPMGWIDERTRKGRRFKLEGSDERVEYVDITDGRVHIVWVDGAFTGKTFFPAGDIPVKQWNDEYAATVEGYVDVVQPEEPEPEEDADEE